MMQYARVVIVEVRLACVHDLYAGHTLSHNKHLARLCPNAVQQCENAALARGQLDCALRMLQCK